MHSKWRKYAAPIILEIIEKYGTENMTFLRKKLREAYPFGIYGYHPKRIWLNEIRKQLGLVKPKPKPEQKERLF